MKQWATAGQRLFGAFTFFTIRTSIYCSWKIYFPAVVKEDFLSSNNVKFFRK